MIWTDVRLVSWVLVLVPIAWLPARRWQATAIALVGLVFLALNAPRSLVMLASLGLAGHILSRKGQGQGWRVATLALLAAAVAVCFKWSLRLDDPMVGGAIPLGMAYYSLRILHYAFAAYTGTLPKHSWAEYARYLLFFPTLVAGPINRFPEFRRDGNRRRWDSGLFASGLERMLYGYVKITVLANWLVMARLGTWLQQTVLPAWAAHYFECLRYGLNLYLQFSGYSDIAIGLALLLGYRIAENFHWPFLAINISQFWRRWHITLSEWCRDYVFSPTASLTRNPYLGVLASMIILGLWHELSLRYAFWGLYHGAGIATWHGLQRIKPAAWTFSARGPQLLARSFSWAMTFNFVILSFAITSAPSLTQAWRILLTILTFAGGSGV